MSRSYSAAIVVCLALLACTLITATAPAFAQQALSSGDLAGAKDHPAIKRFAGSSIITYDYKAFDGMDLPTSTFQKFNLKTYAREFAEPAQRVEGARTRIGYEAAGDTTSVELFRNYRSEERRVGKECSS